MTSAPQDPFARDPWLAAKPRRAWRTPKWLIVVLVLCAVGMATVFAGLAALAIAIEIGHMPDSKALSRRELRPATLDWLTENGLVESGETVEYFYADGFFDFGEAGCLVTDRRVVNYWRGDTEALEVASAPLGEIIRIDTNFTDDWAGSSDIFIETADQNELQLSVFNEEGGDRGFDRTLRKLWLSSRARTIAGWNDDGTMPLVRQLGILAEFGIALRPGCAVSAGPMDTERYEKDPFGLVLRELGHPVDADCDSDVRLLDHDAVVEEGDYTILLSHLRALSDGALAIDEISDTFDVEKGVATVTFRHGSEMKSWDAEIDETWVDATILARADQLLVEGASGRRFAFAYLADDGLSIVVCIDAARLVELRRKTGVDFEFIE